MKKIRDFLSLKLERRFKMFRGKKGVEEQELVNTLIAIGLLLVLGTIIYLIASGEFSKFLAFFRRFI